MRYRIRERGPLLVNEGNARRVEEFGFLGQVGLRERMLLEPPVRKDELQLTIRGGRVERR